MFGTNTGLHDRWRLSVPHCTAPTRSEGAVPSPRRDVVWNTYRECDARCSASHLSLIQPSVRAFTPPSTRILEMITAALSTTTAPTISSIWVLDLAPRRATRTVSIGRAPRCSLPHRATTCEVLVLQPLGCGQMGTDALHSVCLWTREQRGSAPLLTLATCRSNPSRPPSSLSVSRRCVPQEVLR